MKVLVIAITPAVLVLAAALAASAQGLPSAPPSVNSHCVSGCGNNSGGSRSSRSAEDLQAEAQYSSYAAAYNLATGIYKRFAKVPPEQALELTQTALADVDEALGYEPGDANALTFRRQIQAKQQELLGEIAAARGDFDQAIAYFLAAGQIFPESNNRWQELIAWANENKAWAIGNQMHSQQNYTGAESIWRQLLSVDPKNESLYYNLGLALENQGRTDEALAAYQQAHRLNPKAKDAAAKVAETKSTIQDNRQTQALQQQDAAAAQNISSSLGALLNSLNAGDGETKSEYRQVHGQKTEFTTLDRPGAVGHASAIDEAAGVAAGDAAGASSTRNGGADASDRLQFGIDSAGHRAATESAVSINGVQSSGAAEQLLKKFPNDAGIQGYLRERDEAFKRYQQLGDELKEINQKVVKREGDPQALKVQAATVMDQMSAQKSTADSAQVNAEDRARKLSFAIDLTPEQPVKKPVTVPPPPPGAAKE